MYVAPRITDMGRIELYTHDVPGSSTEPEESPEVTGGGGGDGIGLGLIGLLGGAIALVGQGDDQAAPAAAVSPDEEEEKLAQK